MTPGTKESEKRSLHTAYRCQCGYVHENAPSNHVTVEAGDYCVKCGRQFTEDDQHTRSTGELFEWEVGDV